MDCDKKTPCLKALNKKPVLALQTPQNYKNFSRLNSKPTYYFFSTKLLNHFCFKSDQTDFVEELLVGGSVHDDRARKLLDEIWNKKTWLLTANTVKRIVT